MIITMTDVRQHMGYCAKGVRLFVMRHGWDLEDALQNGIDSEKLIATGDHMAIELVKKIEEARDGRR